MSGSASPESIRSLADVELVRTRWRRALTRFALDADDREDFASGGFTSRLEIPTVQLVLLPADPQQNVVVLDDDLLAWLRERRDVTLKDYRLRLGNNVRVSAHAAVLTDGHPGVGDWPSYVAIHRSGAVEAGLGMHGGGENIRQDGNRVRYFTLISTVVYSWAVLDLASKLQARLGLDGPWLLTVGMQATQGAFLADFGDGWRRFGAPYNNDQACVDENLLWHMELESLPAAQKQQELALGIGDRMENAWGTTMRRYLNREGDRSGQLGFSRW
ncbi:hypothetical protein BH23ACT5_BH23ACT5_06750 [soil metagenome]